ncbi:MAG: hypothetical protein A3J37_08745 [Alphaproteobacteria bacterium RIFCSPHIGHO2_12_FULL_45_9]|nr:MAG: hypothetical protein A3B66_07210 [Alphaproteobacteria bacterium RIFCSPHIGHO2_02_FULL_46_13]OFW98412.1 MAG: hypothetical protein A3J37_08745 [Alphaproteobacteria bacterium RIFCSPHIGHO2_12_FULL_45_9]
MFTEAGNPTRDMQQALQFILVVFVGEWLLASSDLGVFIKGQSGIGVLFTVTCTGVSQKA